MTHGVNAAPERRLGEPVRTFDGQAGRRRALAWLVLLGLAAAALVPAAAVYLAAGEWWLGVPAVALAAGYAGAVAWIARNGRLRGRNQVVRLYSGGLAVSGPDGNEEYIWDDLVSVTVAGVRRGSRGRTRWRFTVVADDGRVLRFGDGLPDVQELGEAVAAEVTARAVPRHLAAVKAGETVRLGPFTVDLDGVGKEGERLPWHAVRDVVIDDGLVAVRVHGPTSGPGSGPGSAMSRTALAAIAGHMPDALAFAALCPQVKALNGNGR